jgi:hypothetical protein
LICCEDFGCGEVVSTSKPIKDVAVAHGVGPETVRNWLIGLRRQALTARIRHFFDSSPIGGVCLILGG